MANNDFPTRTFINVNDVTFAAYEANGDVDGKNPPVILLHGWPEIAYCWKNQINTIAAAGYRVIAIDLKGFGYSSHPPDPAHYSAKFLTSEYAALLDTLEIERAIFCGHDWGGALVWSMAQWQPNRVAGVIGVCTPLRKRPPVAPLTILRKRFGDRHYIVQFQKDGVCEDLFATDIERLSLIHI